MVIVIEGLFTLNHSFAGFLMYYPIMILILLNYRNKAYVFLIVIMCSMYMGIRSLVKHYNLETILLFTISILYLILLAIILKKKESEESEKDGEDIPIEKQKD